MTTKATGAIIGAVALVASHTTVLAGTSTAGHRPGQAVGELAAAQVSGSSGRDHTVAVKSDGTVWAWGGNAFSQLGDGTNQDRYRPVRVSGLAQVARAPGKVSAGGLHTLVVKTDGTVWAWGWNGDGEIGDGTLETRSRPVRVAGLTDVVSVSAGDGFSLALKRDGTVWAWGANEKGQLGDGTKTRRTKPVRVLNLGGVAQIDAGTWHSVAVKTDGTPLSWGHNYSGQLGTGPGPDKTKPGVIQGLTGVATHSGAISAGHYNSLMAKKDGTLATWGTNYLGNGTTDDSDRPILIGGLTGVKSVSSNVMAGFAVRSNGQIVSWGYDEWGNLGNGDPYRETQLYPVAVKTITNAVSVDSGGGHVLAVTADGGVWTWGDNGSGKLGDGFSTRYRTAPWRVPGIS